MAVARPQQPPAGPPPAAAAAPPAARPARVTGLDGIRGLAALFVVLNHIFEKSWPGYPGATQAPFWASWLIYGRAAVAVFIVLSGFSLGLGPARAGWRFASLRSYAHRRAWRILPPYWAALAFSLVLTWYVVAQPHLPVPDGKSVWVYGTLLQDVFAVGSPNRAFWSIAIEAQLYVLLPLMLLMVRRVSAWAMAGLVAAIVVTAGALGPSVPFMNTAVVKFTPDLAVLFATGVLAAGITTAGEAARSRPWARYALAAAVPPVVLMVAAGSVWNNLNLFWLDLAWTPAIGFFLTAIATGRPRRAVAFLSSRLPRSLGSCSYSLYLTHVPIVVAVTYGLVVPRIPAGPLRFTVLVVVLVPLCAGFARLFAALFEIPFQRHRGWVPLGQAVSARLAQARAALARQRASAAVRPVPASGPQSPADARYTPAHRPPAGGGARPASLPARAPAPGPAVPPGPRRS